MPAASPAAPTAAWTTVGPSAAFPPQTTWAASPATPETLTDCRALTTLTADAYVGAIAGDVFDNATVSGNRFAGESQGGIDGISYAGMAEPVTCTLCAE